MSIPNSLLVKASDEHHLGILFPIASILVLQGTCGWATIDGRRERYVQPAGLGPEADSHTLAQDNT